MTTYDFTTDIDRSGTHSVKWTMYGEDVLPMWIADMEFGAPPAVIDAIRARLEHPVFGYQEDSPSLREAIAERQAARHGWQVNPEWIVLLPGLVMGLNLVAHTVGERGDGILMTPPIYPPFLQVCQTHDRQGQYAPLTHHVDGHIMHYTLDADAMRAALTERTRLLLFCNPHNPTGRVFTRAELGQVAAVAEEHNLILCSDEIHAELMMGESQHIPLATLAPEIAARSITLVAPSKAFNLPGLGCAAAIVPDAALRNKLRMTKYSYGALTNILGYAAAEAAYRHGDEWLAGLRTQLTANRDTVVDFVEEQLPGVTVTRPEATYLSWLDFRALGIEKPATFFLEKAKVALNEGEVFGMGGAGFARLNYGCSPGMLMKGLGRLEAAIREHIPNYPKLNPS
jgi:cystathionine beta-lyase